jgi:hypothetical protein
MNGRLSHDFMASWDAQLFHVIFCVRDRLCVEQRDFHACISMSARTSHPVSAYAYQHSGQQSDTANNWSTAAVGWVHTCTISMYTPKTYYFVHSICLVDISLTICMLADAQHCSDSLIMHIAENSQITFSRCSLKTSHRDSRLTPGMFDMRIDWCKRSLFTGVNWCFEDCSFF